MPGGDGTGPRGLGSMTGRAAGYCAGYSTPGFANPVPRMGLGLGQGGGFGGYPYGYMRPGQYPYGGQYQYGGQYPYGGNYPTPYPYPNPMPMRPYYGMGFFGGRGGGRGRRFRF